MYVVWNSFTGIFSRTSVTYHQTLDEFRSTDSWVLCPCVFGSVAHGLVVPLVLLISMNIGDHSLSGGPYLTNKNMCKGKNLPIKGKNTLCGTFRKMLPRFDWNLRTKALVSLRKPFGCTYFHTYRQPRGRASYGAYRYDVWDYHKKGKHQNCLDIDWGWSKQQDLFFFGTLHHRLIYYINFRQYTYKFISTKPCYRYKVSWLWEL